MSFQAMSWAVGQKLPTNEKFLLLMLANYASNERGDCYPSLNRLCEDTSLSRDTVIRVIKTLESRGLIEVVRRKMDAVNLPNIYRLNLGVVAVSDHGGVVAGSDHLSNPAGGVVAGSDSNQSLNLSIKKKKESASARGKEIDFDFDNGIFVELDDYQKGSWQKAYPATNVDVEVLRAAVWLTANPANRKSNYLRFLTNWLSRAQDRAGRLITHTGVIHGQPRTASVTDRRNQWITGLTGRTPGQQPDLNDLH